MRLLLDECCPKSIIKSLLKRGHNVLHILNHRPGASDDDVISLANKTKRILISNNVKHFRGSKYKLKNTPGRILIESDNALSQELILNKLFYQYKSSKFFHEKIYILLVKKFKVIDNKFGKAKEYQYQVSTKKKKRKKRKK